MPAFGSPPGPWTQLPVPGMPGVETLQRQISERENADRARSAYWTRLGRVGAWFLLGVLIIVLVPLMGWGALSLYLLVPVGIGLAIGVTMGLVMSKRLAENELGAMRVMTVAWNGAGFSLVGARGLRAVAFGDVRRAKLVGPDSWFLAVYTPVQWFATEPNVILIPRDLVPQWALTRLVAS